MPIYKNCKRKKNGLIDNQSAPSNSQMPSQSRAIFASFLFSGLPPRAMEKYITANAASNTPPNIKIRLVTTV